ncbi:cytochrome b [Shimia sp. R11_0]|uniref:cytochrome b n=1 Tax=Shimia sp. R11_0 TaxID=2821096 RepID=UPI002468C1AD|nr:cytochrome b [Shimia sp. R11_0]
MSTKPLSKLERSLHWGVGLGMILLIGLGLYMSENRLFALYPIHKSLGVLLFAFILFRVVVRLRQGWPAHISQGAAWERKLALITHWILIAGTLVLPLSGILDGVMAGRGLSVFGLELIGANLSDEGQRLAISEGISDLAGTVHGFAGKFLVGVIALHVVGAFKHHVIDRDATLRRMLGRT